jgi:hypothetical protein
MIGTGSSSWNPPADVVLDNERRLLHHKYLIIDSDGGPGQPVVVTGSYNWSYAAESRNDENFLIIKDTTIANLYLQEFAERYHRAGGKENLFVTSVEQNPGNILPVTIKLFPNYPNPFNSFTNIDYQIAGASYQDVELSIYNLLGQKVRTLVKQSQVGGSYSVSWDGTNELGGLVSSGVYIYQLNVSNVVNKQKLIMLR